jgi:hypothetical protein
MQVRQHHSLDIGGVDADSGERLRERGHRGPVPLVDGLDSGADAGVEEDQTVRVVHKPTVHRERLERTVLRMPFRHPSHPRQDESIDSREPPQRHSHRPYRLPAMGVRGRLWAPVPGIGRVIRDQVARSVAAVGGTFTPVSADEPNEQLDAVIQDEVVPSVAEVYEDDPEEIALDAPGLDEALREAAELLDPHPPHAA